ncbi:type II secretion system F family protein [Gammaproteobacteria bacterium AH-315-C21]|nr:type II secretion system F family protein [Gammaproteobacteria bacterium AH-315-C21]
MAEKAIQAATFTWVGADKRGTKIKGELQGNSIPLVKAQLRRQGINPLRVKKKAKPLFSSSKKITAKDIAIFTRQLATMLSAGVPVVQAFEIIGRGHENPAMQTLIGTVRGDVEAGNNLADSFRKHPRQFDDLFCNLIAAGEQAGILEALLHKIAIYKEKTESIKSKVKKALTYPTAVIVVAFMITSILLIFVVPQFKSVFEGFGADLPAMTLFVVSISETFQAYWYIIFGGISAAVFLFINAHRKSKKVRDAVDRLILKMPVIGNILHKAAIARFARTLSTMFAAGVPLVESMGSVAGAAGNVVYSNAILRVRDEVSTGTALNAAMMHTGVFPNMVNQMVAIGEESGSLDAMLGKVADFYEEEVDNLVDSMASLIEPIIMAFLGVVVGGLVIAMYLPIFKLGEVV